MRPATLLLRLYNEVSNKYLLAHNVQIFLAQSLKQVERYSST